MKNFTLKKKKKVFQYLGEDDASPRKLKYLIFNFDFGIEGQKDCCGV